MVIVKTPDGRSSQPVKWIGQRRIELTVHPGLGTAAPVRIMRDAIAPIESSTDRYVFILPPGTDRVVLSSRATRPADIVRYLDDRRKLGIAVGSITLQASEDRAVFPADRIPAGAGWHHHEHGDDKLWRWTGGTGELRFDPLTQAAMMQIRLSGSAHYIVEQAEARAAA